METIENQLKQLILNNYDSISAFLKKIDMPRQTFESIMKRGIKKANKIYFYNNISYIIIFVLTFIFKIKI